MLSLICATDPPNITELVYYDYADSLECVSTSSPPTIVSWMKDGIALIIDNSTNYNLTQTITNRTSSTYSNVLTVSEGVPGGMAGTYTCTITNDLGSASSMVVATGECFTLGPALRLQSHYLCHYAFVACVFITLTKRRV